MLSDQELMGRTGPGPWYGPLLWRDEPLLDLQTPDHSPPRPTRAPVLTHGPLSLGPSESAPPRLRRLASPPPPSAHLLGLRPRSVVMATRLGEALTRTYGPMTGLAQWVGPG